MYSLAEHHWSEPQWRHGNEASGYPPYNSVDHPTEAMPAQNQWHDPQWASPGQGQARQFYDPNQYYYDPNNPHEWQLGAQMPGSGPPPKPAYKQWWFWAVIGIVIVGIVVLIIALFPGDDDEPTPTGPAEPLDPTNDPELEQQPDPAEEPDNAGIVQGDGGSDDEALAAAQERVDNGFSYLGT